MRRHRATSTQSTVDRGLEHAPSFVLEVPCSACGDWRVVVERDYPRPVVCPTCEPREAVA